MKFRQPASGLAKVGAGGDRATREGEGDLRPDYRVCVFSRRQSGLVPAFLSSGVPKRTPGDQGWPGLAGWMKAQIRGKTKNRGHNWDDFRRPDEKRAAEGLAGTMAGDTLTICDCGNRPGKKGSGGERSCRGGVGCRRRRRPTIVRGIGNA
jgi:hypothetical protein